MYAEPERIWICTITNSVIYCVDFFYVQRFFSSSNMLFHKMKFPPISRMLHICAYATLLYYIWHTYILCTAIYCMYNLFDMSTRRILLMGYKEDNIIFFYSYNFCWAFFSSSSHIMLYVYVHIIFHPLFHNVHIWKFSFSFCIVNIYTLHMAWHCSKVRWDMNVEIWIL